MVNFNNFSECTYDLTDGSEFSVGLDWLSFTFKMPDEDFFNQKFLSQESAFRFYCKELAFIFDDAFVFKKNSSHYRFAYGFHENCAFFHDGFEVNKGFNVSVPGHALSWFFDSAGMSVLDMFLYFENHYISVSRLDVAVDDFSKSFRPDYYCRLMENNMLKTRIRYWSYIGSDRSTGGRTFALGKRNTQKYLRIYDKDKESNGEIDAVRYEFELHRNTAQKFIYELGKKKLCDCILALFDSFFRVLACPVESFAGQHFKDDIFDAGYYLWLKTQVLRINNIVFQCNNYTKKERSYVQMQHTEKHLRKLALDVACGFISFEEVVTCLKTLNFSKKELDFIKTYNVAPEILDFVKSPFDTFELAFKQSSIDDFYGDWYKSSGVKKTV